MSPFVKAFFGSFIGKIVATLLIAGSIVCGFAPEDFAKTMIESAPLLAFLRIIFLSIGIVLGAMWIDYLWVRQNALIHAATLLGGTSEIDSLPQPESPELLRAKAELEKQKRVKDIQDLRREEIAHEKFVLYRDEKLISLPDAAQIAYDELDGTLWREQADRWPKPEERLDFMATYIVHNAPVQGCSPPSRVRKHISQDEFRSGVIKNGGKSFQRHHESHDTFTDLALREEDLRDAIKRMKAGS